MTTTNNGLKTTNYFSHDSNARNDEKLLRLRMKHGAAGYGVYFMLLERLREEADYTSAKDYNMIAFDLRVDAALIKSVVEDFGLFAFTENGKCFYSDSFTRRMGVKDEAKKKRSVAGRKGSEKRWTEQPPADPSAKPEQAEQTTQTVSTDEPQPPAARTASTSAPPAGARSEEAEYLERFFRPENRQSIEALLVQFGLKPTDTPALKAMARDVVAEWRVADMHHTDYTDWARHLVNTLRIRQIKGNDGNNKPRLGEVDRQAQRLAAEFATRYGAF